jgi:16S rRNA (adenine1518-N6/adenine1519-N6)-dimethyltransferase
MSEAREGSAAWLREHGLAARKRFGQHFLLDSQLCAKIVRLAGDLQGVHVAEIGPGPGGLTRALLESPAASVTAVELDARFAAALAPLMQASEGRLRLVEADALKIDVTSLLDPPRAIVANLPYNVGTALLVGWLKTIGAFRSLTLMFQKEVAERIVAAPDGDAYGRLAVLAQSLASARIVLHIPARAFTPPPKVDSAVVHLTPRVGAPDGPLLAALEKVTEAAFGQRRKMLRSSLKSLGPHGLAALEESGIDGTRRAETLSIEEFQKLARAFISVS